jgi:hypothetical protein
MKGLGDEGMKGLVIQNCAIWEQLNLISFLIIIMKCQLY